MSSMVYSRRGIRPICTAQAVAGTPYTSAVIPLLYNVAEFKTPSLFAMLHVSGTSSGTTDNGALDIYPVFWRGTGNDTFDVALKDTTPAEPIVLPMASESPYRRTFHIDPRIYGDGFSFTLSRPTGTTDTFTFSTWVSWYGAPML